MKTVFLHRKVCAIYAYYVCMGLPCGSVGKSPPAMQQTWVQSLDQEDPRWRKLQATQVFLPGKSQGPRSLVGYNPLSCRESYVAD